MTAVGQEARVGMTADEVYSKIDWEGGIYGALQYGLSARDIADPDLARAWDELSTRFNHVDEEARGFMRILEGKALSEQRSV